MKFLLLWFMSIILSIFPIAYCSSEISIVVSEDVYINIETSEEHTINLGSNLILNIDSIEQAGSDSVVEEIKEVENKHKIVVIRNVDIWIAIASSLFIIMMAIILVLDKGIKLDDWINGKAEFDFQQSWASIASLVSSILAALALAPPLLTAENSIAESNLAIVIVLLGLSILLAPAVFKITLESSDSDGDTVYKGGVGFYFLASFFTIFGLTAQLILASSFLQQLEIFSYDPFIQNVFIVVIPVIIGIIVGLYLITNMVQTVHIAYSPKVPPSPSSLQNKPQIKSFPLL